MQLSDDKKVLIRVENEEIFNGTVRIPSSVTVIGDGAFLSCSSLVALILPEGLMRIGQSAFCRCSSLTSLTLPAGLIEIGGMAFYGCIGLESLNLPEGLKEVGSEAFAFCTSLKSLTLQAGLTEINFRLFHFCRSLTSLTFRAGLRGIGKEAFMGCNQLELLTLPYGVEKICLGAFIGCSGLASLTLPNSLKWIGYSAFSGCSSLTSLTFPKGLTIIGGRAFWNCIGLVSLTFPEGLIRIYDSAFSGCDALEQINIDTNSEIEFNRIKALLPPKLRDKARSLAPYQSTLNRLIRCPAVSKLYLSEQRGEIPLLNPDIRALIETYHLDDNPYYRQVKSFIFALPNLSDSSDALDGNQNAVTVYVDQVIEQAKRDHYAALKRSFMEAVPAKKALDFESDRAEPSAKLKTGRCISIEQAAAETGFFDSPNTKANDNNAEPPQSDMSVDEESQYAIVPITKS